MKRMAMLTVAVVLGLASVAYAACRTHTYIVNGIVTTCTTCCSGNTCTSHCF